VVGHDWIARNVRGRVTFRTDIDRQRIMPFGSIAEVKEEVHRTFEACGSSKGGIVACGEVGPRPAAGKCPRHVRGVPGNTERTSRERGNAKQAPPQRCRNVEVGSGKGEEEIVKAGGNVAWIRMLNFPHSLILMLGCRLHREEVFRSARKVSRLHQRQQEIKQTPRMDIWGKMVRPEGPSRRRMSRSTE